VITVTAAKTEGRIRDGRRQRLVLSIGKRKIHITRDEAAFLRRALGRVLGGGVIQAGKDRVPTRWNDDDDGPDMQEEGDR
jgi:hypothetical protein